MRGGGCKRERKEGQQEDEELACEEDEEEVGDFHVLGSELAIFFLTHDAMLLL